MSDPVEYVQGFCFANNNARDRVLLLRKDRGPEHLINKWIGVGGKINPNEAPIEAMIREFEEETRLVETDWWPLCTIISKGRIIHNFVATHPSKNMTSAVQWAAQDPKYEELRVVYWQVECLRYHSNIRWLLGLACDPEEPIVIRAH